MAARLLVNGVTGRLIQASSHRALTRLYLALNHTAPALGANRPLNFRATTLPAYNRDVGRPDSQWQLNVDSGHIRRGNQACDFIHEIGRY